MVSVIVTSYKRPAEIVERAVQSILSQTYQDIEILIVDDNPDGNKESQELKKQFENREKITYIKQDGNQGACAARNLGISKAKGEFIGFLDDDDTWFEDKLECQLERFAQGDDSVGMVYCLGQVYDCDTNPPTITDYYTTRIFKDEIRFEDQLVYDYCGSTSQALVRKEVFEKIGGFNVNLPARQDYEMWLRISKYYKIYGVNKPLFYYYHHGLEQITKSPKKALTGYQVVYREYKEDYKKNPKAQIEIFSRMLETAKGHYFFTYWYYRIRKHLVMLLRGK